MVKIENKNIEELYDEIKIEKVKIAQINSKLKNLRDKREILEKKIALNKLIN